MAKKARSKKARPAKSKAGAKTAKTAAKPKAEKPEAEKPKKVKCPLTRAQLKVMQQALLAKRKAIMGDMSGMEAEALGTGHGAAGDLSNMPTHPADIGTDNYEQEFTLGLLESERILLMEIDEALERIENNTYGICLGTGNPINKARLEARPWSKYCIEYARLLEKGLIRPGEENQAD